FGQQKTNMLADSNSRTHPVYVFLRPLYKLPLNPRFNKQIALVDDRNQIRFAGAKCRVHYTRMGEWPVPHLVPGPQSSENTGPLAASALCLLCDGSAVDRFYRPGVTVQPFHGPAVRAAGRVGRGPATTHGGPTPIVKPILFAEEHRQASG